MKYLVSVLFLANIAFGKTLPDYASQYVCRRSDPELNECLLNNLNKAIPHLFPLGIPEIGIKPKDPWFIPFMTAEGDLQNVQVKMIMKNTTLTGFSKTTIKALKFNPETLTGEVIFNVPHIRMQCEYYSTGRLFIIPLENSAFFDGNFTNMDSGMKFKLRQVERKNGKFLTFEKNAFKGRVDRAHVKITAIKPEQQTMVDVLENFFNENDRLVLDTVNPLFASYSADFFKQTIEEGLKIIPADQLLPY
jgi:hypothetical protein